MARESQDGQLESQESCILVDSPLILWPQMIYLACLHL